MPFDTPLGERLTASLKPEEETQEQMIKRLIDEHQQEVPQILTGQKYYEHQNDIVRQQPKLDLRGNLDPTKPDWKITTNYHQNLVDQKVSYVLGKPVQFATKNGGHLDDITEVLDNRWDNKLIDVLTAASNKGVEYVHPYLDEEGTLKFYRVPAEQAIPIWKDKEREELTAFIRYYELNDELKVEYWDKDTVTYYVMNDLEIIPDYYWGEPVQTHHSQGGWGRVPFVPFKNNPEEKSDIWLYKSLIDAIDKGLSDTQNTFDESVELLYVLRGYEGENLQEFMDGMKYYKAINVDSEGGVETIQVEVPVASRKDFFDILRQDIIEFGQGVDFQTDKFGNSPSGIALKFLYSNLDLKANKLKNKLQLALQDLLLYVIEYKGLKLDPKDVEIIFNFNRMVNDSEQSTIAAQSTGIISNETIIANHPWVEDKQAEMERLEQQQMEYNTTLPEIEEGDDEETGQETEDNQDK